MHVEEMIVSECEDFVVTRTIIRPFRPSDRSFQEPATQSRFTSLRFPSSRIVQKCLWCRNSDGFDLDIDHGFLSNTQLAGKGRPIEIYRTRVVTVEISEDLEGDEPWTWKITHPDGSVENRHEHDSVDFIGVSEAQRAFVDVNIIGDVALMLL